MTSPARRLHERWPLALPLVVVHEGQEHPGTSRNFSLGGMLVDVPSGLPFGATVTVRLVFPPLKEESTLEATVRWIKGAEIGLQFGSLRARDVWALNQLYKADAGA